MECDSERLWKLVENVRQNVIKQRRPDSQFLSDWLFNAFIDSAHTCSDKRFRGSTNILQQLPHENIHVSFIVSLYSDEKGYSITLCPQGREGLTNLKQMFLPYEDNEIFSYLDNGEIPPVVLEVLEKTQYCFLYDGCMFCKVVNYRDRANASQETTLLLLRPTAESMLSAVNIVAKEKSCSREERFQIESKLLVATQPPLCLDPNIEVACITNRLQYNRRKLHTPAMKRYLRRRSQAARARTHLYSTRPAPKSLKLHSFVTHHKVEKGSVSEPDRPRPNSTDSWKHRGKKPLVPPCTTEELGKAVAKLARSLIPPEAAILKPKPVMETTPQPKAAGQNTAVSATGTPAHPVGLPEVSQLLEEPKPEQAKQTPQPAAPQPAPVNPLKRPHSTLTSATGPKLRPLLPTTEATRRIIRERALSQVSSDQQKPRPIMPSLSLVSGRGAGGSAIRGPRPSTVFVQPVSSSVLSTTKPILRGASSTQLPPVQLLVSSIQGSSSSITPRPPSMSTSTAKLIPKLHNPPLPAMSSSVHQLANLPKLTHIAQGTQSAPSIPQKVTPIKQSTSAPSMPQLHKMPPSSTSSSHTQKP